MINQTCSAFLDEISSSVQSRKFDQAIPAWLSERQPLVTVGEAPVTSFPDLYTIESWRVPRHRHSRQSPLPFHFLSTHNKDARCGRFQTPEGARTPAYPGRVRGDKTRSRISRYSDPDADATFRLTRSQHGALFVANSSPYFDN